MFDEVKRHESRSGANLAYRHEAAVGAARGILVICHGLAEHSGRYGEFARFMSGHGFHVYGHDHRGHGHTTAPDATIGRFASRDGVGKVLEDVQAVRDMAARAHRGLPVILFGHSMGGLIALNAAINEPNAFQGLSIWNSNFHPGAAGRLAQGVLLAEKALKGADVPSTILPLATFRTWGRSMPEKRTESDWLSSHQNEVDAYIADPLCGFDASVSLWLDVFALTFRGPSLADRLPNDLPVYLVGGDTDPATNAGREITWLAKDLKNKGMSRVTTRIWPHTRHETLKETVRREAMSEFASWASKIITAPAE